MAQRCKVCTHPKRDEINRRLLNAGQSGETLAGIGEGYGIGSSAIDRHKANHLRVSASLVSEAKNALTIVGYASDLHARASRILDQAERMLSQADASPRSVQAAAASLREVRGSIELLAKLVVSTAPEVEEQGNSWLDAALTEAVQALALPALPAAHVDQVAEAEIVQVAEAEIVQVAQ